MIDKAAQLHRSTTLSAHRHRYNRLDRIERALQKRLESIRRAKAEQQATAARLLNTPIALS